MSDYKYVQYLIKTLEEQEKIRLEKEIKSKNTKPQNKKSEKIQSKGNTALKILKNRLAAGEITIEEFQELKKVLKET